jgi:hypothetical protein
MTMANSSIGRPEGSNILPSKLNDLEGEWVVSMQFWPTLMLLRNDALRFPDCSGTKASEDMLVDSEQLNMN